MNLREAMCQALVDGWHGDWKMSRVAFHAFRLADIQPPESQEEFLAEITGALRVKTIWLNDRCQVWVARYFRNLNEALWAGRKRDACLVAAQRALGVRSGVPRGAIMKPAREGDKGTDWNVVK